MIGIEELRQALAEEGYDSFTIETKNGNTNILVAENFDGVRRLGSALESLGITFTGIATNKAWFNQQFNARFDFPDGEY